MGVSEHHRRNSPKVLEAKGLPAILSKGPYMGVYQNYGYLFGGSHNKDYSILGSILGSPYFGKLLHQYNPRVPVL